MGAEASLVHLNIPAETAASRALQHETSLWRAARVDIVVNTFTGGTTPSIQFFWETLAAGDIGWVTQWSSAAVTSAGPISVSLSDSLSETFAAGTVNAQHCVFTLQGRLRWQFAGAVNATSINFSASVVGRS